MPGRRGEEQTPDLAFFYFLVGLIVLGDQLTKFFVLQFLPPHASLPLIPGIFYLTIVQNKGIAFGLFRHHEAMLLVLISLSLGALMVFSRHASRLTFGSRLGFGLILGGAIGNWIDRIRLGFVVDFLDFRIWPVFNFADTCITLGVSIFLWMLLKGEKSP